MQRGDLETPISLPSAPALGLPLAWDPGLRQHPVYPLHISSVELLFLVSGKKRVLMFGLWMHMVLREELLWIGGWWESLWK